MSLVVLNAKAGQAAAAALLAGVAGVSISACTPKQSDAGKQSPGDITVAASDTECKLSKTETGTGPSTFVITNNGTKVTEFYVYGAGDRVMGEIENISPGLQRKLIVQLAEPGGYTTACKPGMVGDGIRGNFNVTGNAVQVDTQGKFKEAADSYKNYVTNQTTELITASEAFVAAIKKGDVAGAKDLYPKARTYYERIEPVAESFPNDLDPRLDLREADLRPGDKWTGFHRLEKELWVSGLQPDTNAVADQLMADVKELDAGVKDPKWTIDSTKIAGGAQGLLDEIAKSKITGEEDTFSHTDLWDFQANIDGSRTAVGSVRPILDERDAALGKRVDAAFATVQGLLDKYRAGDGFITYDKVTEPQRQELSRAIDALSAEVSQVQGVIAKQ
ncbi:iron uptake system protein EfeO [Mycobacterium sp. OTB74]|uniref:iron uptake system protein EfeO n=1 Tax=Mycobacterium sp. OTB74 TaxID=1853452 RepID=UPI002476EAD6|nr:iron uptake system protein EfeO [Mycobacterium sp. OTB74]MDH6247432.1 iron uptake system component EfeO [Mycobacterium sp. OTB74]